MDNLKTIIENFRLTEEERKKILEEESILMPDSFKTLAECMLSGCFVVSSKGKDDVLVYPTVLEFYYHEEADGGIKDPIVYHRNTASSIKELIPTGFLHNHVSGIDLTFEHENGGLVRASVLIREFLIKTSSKESQAAMSSFNLDVNKNDGRSTGMYAALFSQFSLFDGFSIHWKDGDSPAAFDQKQRKNVYKYYPGTNKKGQPIFIKNEKEKCPRLWQAVKNK